MQAIIEKDVFGREINTTDFTGKKVLLSFFKTASCPFCNLRVREYIKNYQKWQEDGLEVIAFFASPKDEILKYAGKENPLFYIVADPEMKYYRQFHVKVSYKAMFRSLLLFTRIWQTISAGTFTVKTMTERPIVPADFLLDENQNIVVSHYGVNNADHLSDHQIEEFIKK